MRRTSRPDSSGRHLHRSENRSFEDIALGARSRRERNRGCAARCRAGPSARARPTTRADARGRRSRARQKCRRERPPALSPVACRRPRPSVLTVPSRNAAGRRGRVGSAARRRARPRPRGGRSRTGSRCRSITADLAADALVPALGHDAGPWRRRCRLGLRPAAVREADERAHDGRPARQCRRSGTLQQPDCVHPATAVDRGTTARADRRTRGRRGLPRRCPPAAAPRGREHGRRRGRARARSGPRGDAGRRAARETGSGRRRLRSRSGSRLTASSSSGRQVYERAPFSLGTRPLIRPIALAGWSAARKRSARHAEGRGRRDSDHAVGRDSSSILGNWVPAAIAGNAGDRQDENFLDPDQQCRRASGSEPGQTDRAGRPGRRDRRALSTAARYPGRARHLSPVILGRGMQDWRAPDPNASAQIPSAPPTGFGKGGQAAAWPRLIAAVEAGKTILGRGCAST
jgi:hypothetical protein